MKFTLLQFADILINNLCKKVFLKKTYLIKGKEVN